MKLRDKIGMTICAWIGHSRIITSCFGYQYCGRCGDQIGDTIGSIGISESVGIGHNCEHCYENYKHMTWRDKFMVPYPLTKPMELLEVQKARHRKEMVEFLEARLSEGGSLRVPPATPSADFK
jgi:hypothetical protein